MEPIVCGLKPIALSLILPLVLAACTPTATSTARSSESVPQEALKGIEIYKPIENSSQIQFVVIEVVGYGEDGFDYYLRDQLRQVEFPAGITKAQLARVYIDAGLADSARYLSDPIALHRLATVVGPFLWLRVEYGGMGWGMTQYKVELRDVQSAETVLSMRGSMVVWWRLSTELGPKIVEALARWREDSLLAEESVVQAQPLPRT